MISHLNSRAGELKSQGATEAAQDPNSKVTAQDAEDVMANESKKAGIAAFQFDPNASPEAKAAQARAHVPTNFHHDKKPQAVGIATDIDDGTPDTYDLPPPSKEGAIPASPTTDGQPGMSNGHIHKDEKDDYVEKTGWAPRFGQGSITEEEAGASLLDHATLLESKLDDKFFGAAVLGGGLGWVFLIMACCATFYRTSIRRVRRNFRDDVNREMAKSRLETDTESLEWINSFLVKFWPIYQPVLATTIINSVDQVLSTSTPAFLDSMRMKVFTLGSKPPRMDHVKTYPKAEDDIVLMDWKFSFTPNDKMDLTARQLKNKINPKVVLEIRIGKGMISHGMDIIVEDFAFSGLLRVKLKLQIPFPHIEKIEICFLGKPDIDYVCKPLGGDTLGFDINFIPGLEGFIKEQIHGNLAPIMYDPNVFPIEIAKMLAGNPVDQAIGVLAVTIHGAQGLKNPDKLAGSPDPYAVISLNSRDALGKTKIVKENANPRWNDTLHLIITSLTDTLTLQVFDWNEYRKDKELGTANFPLDQLEAISEHENLQLEVMANGKPRGVIQADVRFFPVLEGIVQEDGTKGPAPESNTGIARLTVEQAKDLDGTKSLIGQLNPYAALILNGKEMHETRKLKRTNNPIWDNGSKEFLITDRKAARLGLVVKDDRDLGTDPILGTYQIKVDDMLQLMDKGQEWYNLAGANTGRAKMMLQWKPVALKGAAGGSGGYITPIGVMRFHFGSARDLRNLETMGKSDPYARVLLSGIEKGKTVTFQNNLNPDWDEIIYVPVHSPREKLVVEVMDQETTGKDRSLGQIDVLASDYIHQAENGEFEVHGEKRQLQEPLRMSGKGSPKGTLNFTVSFYPTLNVVDPEEEAAEKAAEEAAAATTPTVNGNRGSTDERSRSSTINGSAVIAPSSADKDKERELGKIDINLAKQLSKNEKEQEELQGNGPKSAPKVHITPEELVKYGSDGMSSRITVNLKYIPVKMELDPSESINNMGTLRLDVLDADDLPAADRNGFSDPFCKFNLNGKEVYKTQTQKKTLHPSWNEYFEVPVKSRTAADFQVAVWDWDFGDKNDLLGEAKINLNLLEPFKPQEIILRLDGKSGVLRLKMLFKPDYVTRSRQGSSTFSGTFAAPGKIVGAPVKGVGMVGGGVAKGASFLRHGFKGKKDSRDMSNGNIEPPGEQPVMNGDSAYPTIGTPQRAAPMIDASPSVPQTPPSINKRTTSFGAKSTASAVGGAPAGPDTGTAMFMINSASGYPATSKIQVHIKQISTKGSKEVHKTKAIKSTSGQIEWDHEMFRVSCSADTQFQVVVKDDKLLGGHELGEALFFIDDSPAGSEKSVKLPICLKPVLWRNN
ncbi:hypothetical protein P7C71_g4110, partial [Lecanoromycetidae sp. Uapishka_2]